MVRNRAFSHDEQEVTAALNNLFALKTFYDKTTFGKVKPSEELVQLEKRGRTALTPRELQRLLDDVSHSRHPERNRVTVLLSFKAGLRAVEITLLEDVHGAPTCRGA